MKWKLYTLAFSISLFTGLMNAQEFYIEPSVDTAYVDEVINIQFTMSNMNGDISSPSWDESFELLGNAGTFSQTSFINNGMSSKRGYTYHIRPTQSGVFPIIGHCTNADGENLEHTLYLHVKEGTRIGEKKDQQFQRISPFDREKYTTGKKKRKIYRL